MILFGTKKLPSIHPSISSGQLLEGLWSIMRALKLVLLLLFLDVWDPSGLCLTLLDFSKVHANSSASKGISLGGASALFVGSPEPSDERIETPPSLSERTGAGRGRVRLPEKDTTVQVDLGLPKLVKVAKELKHVVEVAL